jgi:hypothetical protein
MLLGCSTVRVYTNNVALMTGALNESIKNGTATFADVKAQIGNPAAQVELKRQLQILGLQDDEITGLVNRYVTNLNQQLDAAQARLGTGPIPAAQMDRALLRATAAAGGRTFTDPGQRGMFASMLTAPTTFVPEGSGGKGRKQIASAAAAKADPSRKSYVGLRSGYGISAATKFNVADLERARISTERFKAAFASLPAAAQQAVIATKGNLSQALQIFAQEGHKLGTVLGSETVKGAEQTAKPLVQRVLAASGHASAAPAMGKAGTQDGQLYGKSWSTAVRKAIMTGKGTILPPGTPPGGTPVAPSGSPAPRINPKENEALIKGLIGAGPSGASPQMLSVKQSLAGASREVGNIFRLLPQTAFEIVRNFGESAKIAGGIISQIAGPYVKPIVDGFKFLKETVVFNIKGVAKVFSDGIVSAAETAKNVAQNAALKVKGAYETLAIKTMLALDGVKALPTKIRSSYETAALRLMMGLDSIKNFPNKVRGKVAQLTQDLPQNIRRLQNKMFYGAQDLAGRGREALGGVRERLSRLRERFGSSARVSGFALREGTLAGAARPFVPDRAAASVKTMSDQINKTVGNIRTQLTETAKNVANSAKLSKILLKDGDIRGAARALMPDKIVQAFNAAVKPIADAARFVQKNLSDAAGFVGKKLTDAGVFIGKKVSDAATKISSAGQKLANSLNVAGKALAAGDLKTALRSLTPDKIAAAMSGARVRAGEMLGSARERIGAFGAQARATGITAYNALLARDVKMFIKALTPDKVWAASSRLVTAISGAAQKVGGAIKLASDTIMFNARAAIALGPAIIKDGFIAVRSSLIEGAKFVKDTIALNLRAAIVVGANDIKNAFNSAKTFISQGGKFILDTVKLNIGAALFVAKGEITRIAEILRTEGPKLRTALTQAGQGVAGAIKGAGTMLAQSIRGVGSMVAAAGRGAAGFLSGGVDAMGRTRGTKSMAGMGNTP